MELLLLALLVALAIALVVSLVSIAVGGAGFILLPYFAAIKAVSRNIGVDSVYVGGYFSFWILGGIAFLFLVEPSVPLVVGFLIAPFLIHLVVSVLINIYSWAIDEMDS